MRFGKAVGGGRRVAAREYAPVLAVFFTMSQTGKAVVVDVSPTGARLRGESLPMEGEELILSVEKVRTYGTVAWALGDECGISFGEPLAPDSLQALRLSVARAGGLPPEIKAALDDWTTGVAR
jgi:PilZ domain-containing protein